MLAKLVTLAEFQQRAGLSLDQFQAAAFAGKLPTSVGEIGGTPLWSETDVIAFLSAMPSPGPHQHQQVAAAVTVPVSIAPQAPSNTIVTIAAAEPLTTLEQVIEKCLAALPDKPPYHVNALPKPLRNLLPVSVREGPASLNEDKRRKEYTLPEIVEYFGVSVKMIEKVMRDFPHSGYRARYKLYSHSTVMQLWNSRDWQVAPAKSGPGQLRVYVWIDALRVHLAKRKAGDSSVAPLRVQADSDALMPATLEEAIARDVHGAIDVIPKPGRKPGVKNKPKLAPAHITPAAADAGEAIQTVTVADGYQPNDWISERAVADYLGLPLETVRIIRKDKIGPAHTYKAGNLAYRFIDVEAWRAANLPVIEHWKSGDDPWLDYPAAAQVLGIGVHNLQKISSPRYKGPNPGPAHTIIEKKVMFRKSALIAWKTHHRAAIERIHADSAQRGAHMREIQKKAVASIKAKVAQRQREESGKAPPAVRLLDDKAGVVIGSKKVFKKIQPALDQIERLKSAAVDTHDGAALANGRATLAEKLAACGTRVTR